MLQELVLILTQFGGGPGDPGNNVVRFLLADFFWGLLLLVSFRFWKKSGDRRHFYFSIAALIGFCRELFMFIAEYGSFRGYFSFESVFRYYPPLEHSLDLLSNLLLGYAFLRFYINFSLFSRYYLVITTSLAIGSYAVIAPLWIQFLDTLQHSPLDGSHYMGAKFHDFPGDLAYRLMAVAVIVPLLISFVYARKKEVRIPWLAFIAFTCFGLDHGLQAINDLAGDRYAPVFGPVRHNLHTLAVIQLVGIYWWEITRQLENKNRFLQSMLDTIPDPIYFKNSNNIFMGSNQNFNTCFSIPNPSLLSGKNDFEVYQDSDTAVRINNEDENLLTNGTGTVLEQQITCEGSREEIFETVKSVFRDVDGKVAGLISISRNITSRKQFEEDLQRKNAELERFIYTLSHDLKTPLVTISVFLGYLENDIIAADLPSIQNDLNYIRNASVKMKSLLDELLELSRVGLVSTKDENVDFQVVVAEALSLHAGLLQQRGVNVVVTGENCSIYGDRRRLLEIWLNLLENAIKYSGDQAYPAINISMDKAGNDVIFCVRDNGMGIDRSFHDNIFGLFNKLDPTSEGSGLGLAMVKRIVELYGGRIWVDSEGIGTGSCFSFTLPKAVNFKVSAA